MSINEPQIPINFYFKFSTNNFMRQPNPERGYLWIFKKIIHEHLWLIDEHFWRKKQRHLCRKEQKTFMTKNKYFWPKTYSFMTFPNAKHSRMPDERNLCPFIWHFQSLLFFVFNIVGGSADTDYIPSVTCGDQQRNILRAVRKPVHDSMDNCTDFYFYKRD